MPAALDVWYSLGESPGVLSDESPIADALSIGVLSMGVLFADELAATDLLASATDAPESVELPLED